VSVISGISVAYNAASVDAIEIAAAANETARIEKLQRHHSVEEAFILQTCNRAETYVVTDNPETGHQVLDETLPNLSCEIVHNLNHEESLHHLLRVACGLESLVLGEDQILGQVRDANKRAHSAGTLGPTLEEAVTKAIHVGERARNETAINEGTISLGSAAVELADREYGLNGAMTLVVGAGEMGTTIARSFAVEPVEEVVIANRTVIHAEHIAVELDINARSIGLDELSAAAADADVLISATGSQDPIVDRETLADAGEMFVIDIAQPCDITSAAADVPEVTYQDLDSLESITMRVKEQRRDAAEEVTALVDEEFDRLLEQYKRQRADDIIAAMYENAAFVKRREVIKAVRDLEEHGDVTDKQREIVKSLADVLVNQLLAAPTKSLRKAAAEDDWTTINTALQLFDPEYESMDIMPDEIEIPDTAENTANDEIRDQLQDLNLWIDGDLEADASGSNALGVVRR
jgi:glutamyl-tRNA reductase